MCSVKIRICSVNMNIPSQFDIEKKLLADKSSRCNKVLLKFYYLLVCFLKSFVLIALTLVTIIILFKQIGVEIQLGNLVKNGLKDEGFLNSSNKKWGINKSLISQMISSQD